MLGISNRFVWKCPTPRLLAHYDRHVSANHLDVGAGTGYFLDRCRFPSRAPRVVLMDLNPDALAFACRRIARYRPESWRGNVLEPVSPVSIDGDGFDSVALNYLLHCLPGSIGSKAVVFDHLRAVMKSNAVLFGATLLSGGVGRSRAAPHLMAFYNRRGIFCNKGDDLTGLERALRQRFRDVSIAAVGCAALFSARA